MLRRSQLLSTTLAALACAGAAWGQDLPREKQLIDGREVSVSSITDVPIRGARDNDADVRTRELWLSKNGPNGWSAWEKHHLEFGPQTPISWSPTEGHWRAYVRVIEISGNAMAEPQLNWVPEDHDTMMEFIIDRSAPSASITAPSSAAVLRSGQQYTISWEVSDPHLHSSPISLYWSDSENGKLVPIAQSLPNSSTYRWTAPDNMFNEARIVLQASDKAGNLAEVASTSIVVDAIAPSCNINGPAACASRTVDVQVLVNDAGPANSVSSTQLWYSPDNGVSWHSGPSVNGNGITSIRWQAPNDGDYLLYLLAVDTAGNANATPASQADSIARLVVDTVNPNIRLDSPIGIVPAGGNSQEGNRRVFSNGDKVSVSFVVEDMQLAPKSVSVFLQESSSSPWTSMGTGLSAVEAFTFSLPDTNAPACRIKVRAVDLCGNVGEVVSTETFKIDNEVETGGGILSPFD